MADREPQHLSMTENVMISTAICVMLGKLPALLLYATFILLEVRILGNVYRRQQMNAKRVHERSILEEMVTRRRKRRNVSDSEGLHVVMEL